MNANNEDYIPAEEYECFGTYDPEHPECKICESIQYCKLAILTAMLEEATKNNGDSNTATLQGGE